VSQPGQAHTHFSHYRLCASSVVGAIFNPTGIAMEFASYTNMDQLPESADMLFAQGEKDSMFFSRPWFENLAHTVIQDAQAMLLACVVDGGKVLAILPLMKRAGDTWYSLRHRYTSLYTLLLAENDRQEILACLVQGLRTLPIDSLLLEPIAENDSRVNGLQRSMEASGFTCHRSFRFYNWVFRVRGQCYEEYMADRPARVRNTIARKERKLEREQGYNIRLFVGDETPQAMTDYHAVYTASWKANEQYAEFLDGMVSAFSQAGWSRLAILYIKGHPAAAQLWFVRHGKASIFRLAYDETWRQYSPGSILTGYLMKHVIDKDQVEEIDFLTGNEEYKRDWMSARRERWTLSCVKNRKPTGKIDLLMKAGKNLFRTRFPSIRHDPAARPRRPS
jgi:hypothetical protein